jgi:proteic killer suppression protein
MIVSFRHRGLRRLYEDNDRSRLPPNQIPKIAVILARLDAADRVQEMDVPALRLHRLKGKLRKFWSVTVHGNWRIVFRFEEGNAFDVDLIDYH